MPPLVLLASTFVVWLAAKGRLAAYWAFATENNRATQAVTGASNAVGGGAVGGLFGVIGDGALPLPSVKDDGLYTSPAPTRRLGGFDWRTPSIAGDR